MICTSGHSWKLQVCNATHLWSIPRCFQCYETLIGKILTVFHIKDSHVPAPCPSASARLAFSNQICPNTPSPQGCPTVCSFCICVLSCDLMRLSLDEFVLTRKAGFRSASLCHMFMRLQRKDFWLSEVIVLSCKAVSFVVSSLWSHKDEDEAGKNSQVRIKGFGL